MTKVLVIDDHPLVLKGCQRALEDAGIGDVTLCENPIDGLRAYRQSKPDVIVVDLTMNNGTLAGLSFIRRLRVHDKRTPMIVLSMHEDPMIASQALRLGASGYILKDSTSADLLKAIEAVLKGKTFLSHAVASSVALMETQGLSSPLQALTLRELQTLELIAQGKSYNDIAQQLHLSYKTIANTGSIIKSKLGVKSLPEMMRVAIDHLPNLAARRGAERGRD